MSSDVKGLNKRAIEKGYKQTDMFTPQQYLKMAMDSVAAKKAQQKEVKNFANEHPHQETNQKQPEYVQPNLFGSNPNNGVKPTTPEQRASAGKMNYMKEVNRKMNDNNSKIIESENVHEGHNLQSVVDRAEKLAKTGTLKSGKTYNIDTVNNDVQRQQRRKEILSGGDKKYTASSVPDSNYYNKKISGKVQKDDEGATTTNSQHGSADHMAMQTHKPETLNNKAKGRHYRNMNDNNSKIEKALQAIEEADKKIEQPVALVKAVGDSTKSAQEANPEIKEPVTCDRLELARALKAKVNNNQKVEV